MHNANGLDADYFIRLCAREFNPDVIRNQCPEDLARAFARAARTACAEVLQEREFQTSAAAHDVLAERQRQITAVGWTPEHDDEHCCDEIAALACYYSMPPAARLWSAESTGYGDTLEEAILPEGWAVKHWDGSENGRRRELVKAGALILAEIERLDRAEQAKQQEVQP